MVQRGQRFRACLGIAMMFDLTQPAAAASLDASAPFTLRLDGRDYRLAAGRLQFGASGTVTLASTQSLSQCVRAGGGTLPATGYRLVHDGLGRSLYLAGPMILLDADTLLLRTSAGDVRCAGGVPADPVFAHGFE